MKPKHTLKYMQLKEEITAWLQSGRLRPHDQIPSENEIAEQFGMSRQTVRQSIGELEREGWLYRVQGKGTFVREGCTNKEEGVKTVGIVTTYISDYIFPHIVRGAESALRNEGYRLLLFSTDNDKQRERECLDMLLKQPLSGLIIEPTKSAEGNPNLSYYLSLDYRQIPYVMINERYPEMNCPYMKMDDEAGGFLAVEHLYNLGHRRIAGFFKTDDLQGVHRLKGFMRAHRHYRIPLLPDRVAHYSTVEKKSVPYQFAVRLLERAEDRPTAFVCYNDELAVQLLDAVRKAGLSVPEHISVVGFDDSPLATATEVKLTTLTHPKSEMGRDAAAFLIGRIEKKADPTAADKKVYQPELVVRASTRLIQAD